jgi:hypothetical protein
MKPAVKWTRRGLVGVLGAASALPLAGQAKVEDDTARARREALLKVKVPRDTQPACIFRA